MKGVVVDEFYLIKRRKLPLLHLHAGNGAVSVCNMMASLIPVGASIALYEHTTNGEINCVLCGNEKAVCDGKEEALQLLYP